MKNFEKILLFIAFICISLLSKAKAYDTFDKLIGNAYVGNLYYGFYQEKDSGLDYAIVTGHRFGRNTKQMIVPPSVTYKGKSYPVWGIQFNVSGEYGTRALNYESLTIPPSIKKICNVSWPILKEVNISDLKAWCEIYFHNYYPQYVSSAHHPERDTEIRFDKKANPLYNGTAILKINNREYKELVMPSDLTEIADYAFINAKCIEAVKYTKVPKEIGKDAFEGCSGLEYVDIPNLKEILSTNGSIFGPGAMLSINGNLVKDLIIPEGTVALGDSTFNRCTSITSITLPASLKKAKGTFAIMPNKKSMIIPGIDWYMNNELSGILDGAIDLYVNGKKIDCLEIPEDTKVIKKDLFRNCSFFTSLKLPESLTEIEESAFKGCKNLKILPEAKNVVSYGISSFDYCDNLETIWLGPATKLLGEYAFYHCPKLMSIYITSPQPPTRIQKDPDGTMTPWSDETRHKSTLYIPFQYLDNYVYPSGNYYEYFRNVKGFEYESGVEEVTDSNERPFRVNGNSIEFSENCRDAAIYSLDGRVITMNPNGIVELEQGLYIIQANGQSSKISIRR